MKKIYSLKTNVILVFIGMVIFDIGYFYRKIKLYGWVNYWNSFTESELIYPVIYLIVAIFLSIYTQIKFKRIKR